MIDYNMNEYVETTYNSRPVTVLKSSVPALRKAEARTLFIKRVDALSNIPVGERVELLVSAYLEYEATQPHG